MNKKTFFITSFFVIVILLTFSNIKLTFLRNIYFVIYLQDETQKTKIQEDFQPFLIDDCHFLWGELISNNNEKTNFKNNHSINLLLNCSEIYAYMLRTIFPYDLLISNKAQEIYPEEQLFKFWLSDSYIKQGNIEKAEEIYLELINENKDNAKAWKSLGDLLWKKKAYEESIHAYKKACNINDILTNGCYFAGLTLRARGTNEEAINYFRKSYWPPSWGIADQLEEELFLQNP